MIIAFLMCFLLIFKIIGTWNIFKYEAINPVLSLVPFYGTYKFYSLIDAKKLFWVYFSNIIFMIGQGVTFIVGYSKISQYIINHSIRLDTNDTVALGLLEDINKYIIVLSVLLLLSILIMFFVRLLLSIKIIEHYDKKNKEKLSYVFFYSFSIFSLGLKINKKTN